MSNNAPRRPILYNGQVYVKPITKTLGGGPKEMKYTYEQARDIVLDNIATTKGVLRAMPKESRMPNEVVISLIMQPEFSAKSYYPDSLFDLDSEKFGLKEIGSRVWKEKNIISLVDEAEEVYDTVLSKMFFVRATEESLERLEFELQKNLFVKKGFQEDIRKIASIGFLPVGTQILGLSDDWEGGKLEAVLHPFEIDKEKTLGHFLDKLNDVGVPMDDVRYKQYSSGITFVSFDGNRDAVNAINNYNPLRTVHPLMMREFPNFNRGTVVNGGPKPASFTIKSPIVVGVIDGGVHKDNPYLANYIESEISVAGDTYDGFLDHGTMVSGAVLYGALNKYSQNDTLPEPFVSVKSFGVLSTTTLHPELYDSIDAIEAIVPENPEISVYNLSIGPRGPIIDDYITRFTYSCDQLSNKYGVLFCVAVGNDGDMPGYDRIQAPADAVNCLAVGAYSKKDGKKIRAPYSSIGPGREGCKMKPDIMAFGGCDQHPIHLISNNISQKIWTTGTSFASPIVAGVAGRLVGESNNSIDALVAKALIIHSAVEKLDQHCHEMGHGVLPDDVNSIVDCSEHSYTLIYRGEIEPGKYAEYLIPWDSAIQEGKAFFSWTIAILTDVDHLSTDDYTAGSTEVTFYPNVNKYKFTNVTGMSLDGSLKKSETVDVMENPERQEYLLANGWKKGAFPITDSTEKKMQREEELRNDLKWDTLDTRSTSKYSKNVNQPAFHIHALGRGSRVYAQKVKFALVLTVTAPKAAVDLYANILNKYPALLPVQLKALNEIEVIVEPKL